MEDGLVGCLGLAIGLKVSHSGEPSLAAQVAEIVREPTGVELLAVIKDDGTRDSKASDNVPSNEPSHFSGGYRGYNLDLYPFGKIVDRHKKVLMLPHSFGKTAEDIHSPCGERQGLTIGVMGVEGTLWMGLTFVTGPH